MIMKKIISASYKIDTPAFQSEEFFHSLSRGYAEIQSKVGTQRISLRPEDVYCFVFWTKNPSDHFIAHLKEVQSPFYLQWTITGYGKKIEPNVPDKREVAERFKSVSRLVGSNRVIWRYDPIFVSLDYPVEKHLRAFEYMARALEGYTRTAVIRDDTLTFE